jgi:hypothetical protein
VQKIERVKTEIIDFVFCSEMCVQKEYQAIFKCANFNYFYVREANGVNFNGPIKRTIKLGRANCCLKFIRAAIKFVLAPERARLFFSLRNAKTADEYFISARRHLICFLLLRMYSHSGRKISLPPIKLCG